LQFIIPPCPSGTPPWQGEKILQRSEILLNGRVLSPPLGEMSPSDGDREGYR